MLGYSGTNMDGCMFDTISGEVIVYSISLLNTASLFVTSGGMQLGTFKYYPVLMYKFEVLVLDLSISIATLYVYFTKGNILELLLFTPLH